jgi:hypothetical protein
MMRLRWYAYWRASRFAIHMGFPTERGGGNRQENGWECGHAATNPEKDQGKAK